MSSADRLSRPGAFGSHTTVDRTARSGNPEDESRGQASPVIGLSAEIERRVADGWNEVCDSLPRTYSNAVHRAGGIAVVLPPSDVATSHPDTLLNRLDGLLLTGGADVHPSTYGEVQHAATTDTNVDRDGFEVALARSALARNLPLLGICRGMQILNVAVGGTLQQHLPDMLGHDRHGSSPGKYSRHDVVLAPETLALGVAGAERFAVHSFHHQGIGRIGKALVVSGRSASDGLIEAIEIPTRGFALGVLWHPEEDETSQIIGSLVAAASRIARSRTRRRIEPSL